MTQKQQNETQNENLPAAEEGSPSQASRFSYEGSKIPLPLLLVWVAFFVWMFAYIALYMVPAFSDM